MSDLLRWAERTERLQPGTIRGWNDERPGSDDEQPSGSDQHPGGDDTRLGAVNERPVRVDEIPLGGDQRSSAGAQGPRKRTYAIHESSQAKRKKQEKQSLTKLQEKLDEITVEEASISEGQSQALMDKVFPGIFSTDAEELRTSELEKVTERTFFIAQHISFLHPPERYLSADEFCERLRLSKEQPLDKNNDDDGEHSLSDGITSATGSIPSSEAVSLPLKVTPLPATESSTEVTTTAAEEDSSSSPETVLGPNETASGSQSKKKRKRRGKKKKKKSSATPGETVAETEEPPLKQPLHAPTKPAGHRTAHRSMKPNLDIENLTKDGFFSGCDCQKEGHIRGATFSGMLAGTSVRLCQHKLEWSRFGRITVALHGQGYTYYGFLKEYGL